MYYLKLPLQLINMANGLGVAYVLTMFYGPANITTMTAHKVLEEIIHPCLQRAQSPLVALTLISKRPTSTPTR
jgi:hypothetical protein